MRVRKLAQLQVGKLDGRLRSTPWPGVYARRETIAGIEFLHLELVGEIRAANRGDPVAENRQVPQIAGFSSRLLLTFLRPFLESLLWVQRKSLSRRRRPTRAWSLRRSRRNWNAVGVFQRPRRASFSSSRRQAMARRKRRKGYVGLRMYDAQRWRQPRASK